MHHMKTSTVRDLRYSFSRIVKWLKAGEIIEAAPSKSPDFEGRLKHLFPKGCKGKGASEIILADRGRL